MECCELQLQRVLLITSNVGSLFGEKVVVKTIDSTVGKCPDLLMSCKKGPFFFIFCPSEKFRHHFWPSFRWARKGFLHTRWKIGTRILDFINIHLFHDDSNLNFIENPTEYSSNRRKALQYTLDKFEEFNGGTLEGDSNCFLFGDFNFRLNLASLVKKLTKQTSEREVVLQLDDNESKGRGHSVSDSSSCGGNASPNVRTDDSEDSGLARTTVSRSTSSSEAEEIRSSFENFDREGVTADASRMMRRKSSVIEYFKPMTRDLLSPKDSPSRTNTNWVLRIGKKRFEYFDSDWLIGEWKSYREDDCEPKLYQLKECHIDFAPTYPWSEEPNCPPKFMNTRPPAWCDRVLFNKNALRNVIQRDPKVEYASFGRERCIGDHKPVMLLFSLQ
uniref:inositol-polyphosphate 5-phosphatase n=1 Tax=Globodera pallida TaxID=36090 RepID=A0A183CJH4_GLOPA